MATLKEDARKLGGGKKDFLVEPARELRTSKKKLPKRGANPDVIPSRRNKANIEKPIGKIGNPTIRKAAGGPMPSSRGTGYGSHFYSTNPMSYNQPSGLKKGGPAKKRRKHHSDGGMEAEIEVKQKRVPKMMAMERAKRMAGLDGLKLGMKRKPRMLKPRGEK